MKTALLHEFDLYILRGSTFNFHKSYRCCRSCFNVAKQLDSPYFLIDHITQGYVEIWMNMKFTQKAFSKIGRIWHDQILFKKTPASAVVNNKSKGDINQ